MKTHTAQNTVLFQDRPLSNTPRLTGQGSLLHATCFDRTDYADSAIRYFLALCLLVSLVVCSRELTASDATTPATAAIVQHAAATPGALADIAPSACHAPL